MIYRLETTPQFDKQLLKLDKPVARQITKWLLDNLAETENPRQHGKSLKYALKEYWRYRIGDYRVLAKIKDDTMIVLAVEVGHRSEVYK